MHSEFTLKLREFYRPIIDANDDAHDMSHMDSVYIEARNINELMGLNVPEKSIGIMAYCHDLFSFHRDNHHILGFNHIMSTNEWFMEDITDKEKWMIAHAILEHRASYKGRHLSVYSELLSSADRGKPDDVTNMLIRSFTYASTTLNKKYSECIIHAVSHIKEKFSSSGYVNYPDIYLKLYGEELDKRTNIINKMVVPSTDFLDLKPNPFSIHLKKKKEDSVKEILGLIVENAKKLN